MFYRQILDSMITTFVYFIFSGLEYLGTIQLYDYRNRTYSPKWGRFIEVDPIRFEGRDLNLYRYVRNWVMELIDPWGLKTRIIITYDTEEIGSFEFEYASHAAIYVDNAGDGNAALFDPSGSYKGVERGLGMTFIGEDADLQDFLEYHHSIGSTAIAVYEFDTTPEEEQAIADRYGYGTDNPALDCSFFCCAGVVSSSISGIGPFSDIEPTLTPGNLANQLDKLLEK